ncbi:cache domain-containing protein, partial [bacterium]|nr:cache domain-containing protein [bacterium]
LREFVAVAGRQGGGFVYYKWPKPGLKDPVEKIAYVQTFAPWGWIVGSGLYLDDIFAYAVETALHLAATAGGGVAVALALVWLISR